MLGRETAADELPSVTEGSDADGTSVNVPAVSETTTNKGGLPGGKANKGGLPGRARPSTTSNAQPLTQIRKRALRK